MKKIFFGLLAFSAIFITSCDNDNSKNETEKHDINSMSNDSAGHVKDTADKDVKIVKVAFTNVDATATASLKEIVDHYLHIKNALTTDNGREAASGAKAMKTAIRKLDKSLLTAEQLAAYEKNEEELKEHAEHIADNSDRIAHQRSHFALMSEVVYILVKDFGAGRSLYHDHCPMYKENQGAMWLSETREVKNPYYGDQMLTCGTVEEVIEK